jgi:Protein of unknown function (DUF2408)
LAVLSVELIPIHQRLVTLRRQLVALAAKEGPHKAELKPIQEELRKIDSLSTYSQVCCHRFSSERICSGTKTNLHLCIFFSSAHVSMETSLDQGGPYLLRKLYAPHCLKNALRSHKKLRQTKSQNMLLHPSSPSMIVLALFVLNWKAWF